jgi:hypothetical protein
LFNDFFKISLFKACFPIFKSFKKIFKSKRMRKKCVPFFFCNFLQLIFARNNNEKFLFFLNFADFKVATDKELTKHFFDFKKVIFFI